MKKALVIGNYGVGNFGDDLLMKSVESQLKELQMDYVVACPGEIPGSVAIMPAGIRSFFRFRWLDFLKELRSCDVVVFGGGGLLNPEERMSLYIWGQIIIMAKIYKKKVIMIGQSFSAIDKVVDFLVNKVDAISVRDSYSYKLLSEKYTGKLVRVDDLAWYLKEKASGGKSTQISINLRPYKHVNPKELKMLVNDLIEEIGSVVNFDEIVILPFGLEDADYCLEILGIGIKQKYKIRIAEVDNILEEINKSKVVVAERLHACIVSVKLDAALISLSYSSKVFSMMSDVGVKSLVNLRKDTKHLNVQDVVRNALAKTYKKPHPRMDEVLKDVLS
jgi:polysaccharide pyruvyl transferase WcaK-like protein